MATWKRDAASGLIVLAPILVTLYVVAWLYGAIASVPFLKRVVKPKYFNGNQTVAELVQVVLTLAIFGALVLSIGYLMRTALGGIVEDAIDRVINRVPGLRMVYNASKMAVETALSGGADLQAPVKLETWEGMRMTAFKTGKTTPDGREVVFLPTAPNITTGFVLEVDPDDLVETDERVEDALTRILSAGFGESREMPLEPFTGGESDESGASSGEDEEAGGEDGSNGDREAGDEGGSNGDREAGGYPGESDSD